MDSPGRRFSGVAEAAYTSAYRPMAFRAAASQAWADTVAAFDPGRSSVMPGYWADRVGYRMYRDQGHTDAAVLLGDLIPFRHKAPDFPAQLAGWLQSHPAVGAAFPPAALDEPFRPSRRLRDLVDAWTRHLSRYGICDGGLFRLPSEMTLTDLYRHSVYFPGPPAINGPGFLAFLEADQIDDLVQANGPAGLAEFALALEWIHEGSHFLQTGDPLLAELAWAAVWVSFVSEHGLSELQANRRTGRSCTIEAPYLRALPLDRRCLGALFVDTADGVRLAVPDSERAYETLCGLTHLLDTRVIRYADYLRHATAILSGLPDERGNDG
ncbi:hypothetical protein QOZ88_06750 [Blastococcus sp. BMG 814]|uniref:DUF1851 domain-containing protein n=1 Tax=Blastococcus carthaginiensis TaxID=3050034 RepID=A0ABT9I9T8_9ACTN|nr:hypothetical protein [Blastococcus carthaginiensis]MDP5182332.1 hypothetical protein [Blastococcus carthaginiensis]